MTSRHALLSQSIQERWQIQAAAPKTLFHTHQRQAPAGKVPNIVLWVFGGAWPGIELAAPAREVRVHPTVARPEKSLNDALFNNQGLREGGTRGISHPVG